MNKKTYIQPVLRVMQVTVRRILAGSVDSKMEELPIDETPYRGEWD